MIYNLYLDEANGFSTDYLPNENVMQACNISEQRTNLYFDMLMMIHCFIFFQIDHGWQGLRYWWWPLRSVGPVLVRQDEAGGSRHP